MTTHSQDPNTTNDVDKDALDDVHKAPLIAHLTELRRRLMWCIAFVLVAFAGAYYFSEQIYDFLVQPLLKALGPDSSHRMIYTALHEAFFTYLKVSFFAAIFITFPLITVQIWKFVAPGLYQHEKKAFLPFLIGTPFLFFAGGALAYYVVIPMAWKFFIQFEKAQTAGAMAIQLEAKVNEYLALVMKLIFAFGLCFELPILLLLLAKVGVVTADGLARGRKYAVVIAFAAAAILTPPDIISQIMLGIPILLLYELSIIAIRMTSGKKKNV
ncbi:MAG: twin-arginine translocase subunit TatC [Kordiimonas sp.]|nr:twin-arginine translocase subunit TatC [Kordiimonas sp.]|tara:strand:- start:1605 stop:2414 length:810 start_codon:yes stop_codon:yes gene_type:complete